MWHETSGELGGIGTGVKRAVVGNHVDAQSPEILPSEVAASLRFIHVVIAGKGVLDIRFSIRSSTHLTGRPKTIEATIAQT